MSASSVVGLSATVEILNRYMGGERRLEIAEKISLNCGVTHSPEYNCHYFLMTFRKQIRKKNSVKMVSILYGVLCFTAHRPIPKV